MEGGREGGKEGGRERYGGSSEGSVVAQRVLKIMQQWLRQQQQQNRMGIYED